MSKNISDFDIPFSGDLIMKDIENNYVDTIDDLEDYLDFIYEDLLKEYDEEKSIIIINKIRKYIKQNY